MSIIMIVLRLIDILKCLIKSMVNRVNTQMLIKKKKVKMFKSSSYFLGSR